ncbi:MAG TPA: hypothetical protein VJR05_03620 [Acidimicrobiia bacterium]|nr:hypothetical protein [Acidimicrobiia bacterium]
MEAELTGVVRIAGDVAPGIRVEIHLEREELSLVSAAGPLGTWPLESIGISARTDGFHLRVEGEELILSTNDDARFALAVGLRSSSSPRLNRQLAAALDVAGEGVGLATEVISEPSLTTREEAARTDSSPVAMGIVAAGALVFIGALVAVARGSGLRVFGLVPAWPFWVICALTLASGGLAMLSEMRGSRTLVLGGLLVGLLGLVGSSSGFGSPNFSWIGDGVLLSGIGTVLSGLLLSVDRLNRS